MYRVAVASNVSSVPSFEKAVATVKTDTRNLGLAKMHESAVVAASGLYRSPKARARVAAALYRQGENIINGLDGVKFPRRAGNMTARAGSAVVSITKG